MLALKRLTRYGKFEDHQFAGLIIEEVPVADSRVIDVDSVISDGLWATSKTSFHREVRITGAVRLTRPEVADLIKLLQTYHDELER